MASCRCPFRFPAPRGAHSVTVDYCQAPTSNKSGHGSATGLQHKRNEGRQTARKGNPQRDGCRARTPARTAAAGPCQHLLHERSAPVRTAENASSITAVMVARGLRYRATYRPRSVAHWFPAG